MKFKSLCRHAAIVLLSVLLVFAACACSNGGSSGNVTPPEPPPIGPGTPDDPDQPEPPQPTEDTAQLIFDNFYKTGFHVKRQQDGVAGHIGELVYSDAQKGKDHAWDFCQWNSGYYFQEDGKFPESFNMLNATRTEQNGTYTWKDPAGSKTFAANPETGYAYLEMNGSVEYPHARPVDGGFMTYVLNFRLDETKNLKLGDMSTLYLEFEYTLEKYETAEYAADQAQFVLYFILRNTNRGSADYGRYMWFGLYPYDNRYTFAPTHTAYDTNTTDGFIYGIGAEHYLYAKPQVGVETYIFFNLLPFVSVAFETAQKEGAFPNSTLQDLQLEGGNYGWEIGGAFDVGMSVSAFNLFAEYTENNTDTNGG